MANENGMLCPPALTRLGYTIGREIGKGSFSRVFISSNKSHPNKEYVCKMIDVNIVPQQWKQKCLKMELKVLKKVQHPNIIKVWDLKKTRNAVFIFMDYAQNGSLYKLLQSEGHPFSERRAKIWFSQILGALSYCHTKGVAHRDIKLDNFLLNADFDALLSDFGFSCITTDKSGEIMRNTTCGQPGYMAPEVEPKTKVWPYDAKAADMYSMGVCLFEMLNFDKPFNESLALSNPLEYVKKQRNKKYKFHAPVHKVLSKEIKDLVHQLLEPKPGLRITADMALLHSGLIPRFD